MMKVCFLIASIFLILNSWGQSKHDVSYLNTLFKKYAYTSNSHPPQLLDSSREFVVPNLWEDDRLTTMKFKNIDSILLWDTSGPFLHMQIHGSGIQYHECERDSNCNTRYFGTLFYKESTVTGMYLMFDVNDSSGRVILTKKVRDEIEKAIKKLNVPVREHYVKLPPPKPIVIPPGQAYFPGHIGETTIPYKDIQHATELRLIKSTWRIVSFVFNMVGAGFNCFGDFKPIINNGEKFNSDLQRLLQYVRPGYTLVFDEITIMNGRGMVEQLKPVVFHSSRVCKCPQHI